MSGFKTARVEPREIVKESDFTFGFDSSIENISLLYNLLIEKEKDFVIGGRVIVDPENAMSIYIEPLTAYSQETGLALGETQRIGPIQLESSDGVSRIDLIQIKAVYEDYDEQHRAINNAASGGRDYLKIKTKKKVSVKVMVKKGELNGSVLSPLTGNNDIINSENNKGWIKLAEVKIDSHVKEISQSNIENITSDSFERENENWTNEKDRTYNLGSIRHIKSLIRKTHKEDGSHKERVIKTSHIATGIGKDEFNSNFLPIGNDLEILDKKIESIKTVYEALLKITQTISEQNENIKQIENKIENTDVILNKHNQDTQVHGASSEAKPGTIIIRDENGRAQVQYPEADNDIARKDMVDNVIEQIDTHRNLTGDVHGATSQLEVNQIVKRDGEGYVQVATPEENDRSNKVATTEFVQKNIEYKEIVGQVSETQRGYYYLTTNVEKGIKNYLRIDLKIMGEGSCCVDFKIKMYITQEGIIEESECYAIGSDYQGEVYLFFQDEKLVVGLPIITNYQQVSGTGYFINDKKIKNILTGETYILEEESEKQKLIKEKVDLVKVLIKYIQLNETGTMLTAKKLQTARTISLAGNVTGCFSFDGDSDVSVQTRISNIPITTIGRFSCVDDEDSTALGYSACATGKCSTAVGSGAKALQTYGVALGRGSSSHEVNSIAVGYSSNAYNIHSIAIGYSAHACKNDSIAMGRTTRTNGCGAITLGFCSQVNGDYSIGLGYCTITKGISSVALGDYVRSDYDYSVALGNCAKACGNYSIVIGQNSCAKDFSIAIGKGTIANKINSTTVGVDSIVNGCCSTSLGFSAGRNNIQKDNTMYLGNAPGCLGALSRLESAVEITVTSDVRFKHSIQAVNNSLCVLKRVEPIVYNWYPEKVRTSEDRFTVGLSAQSVEKSFIEAHENKEIDDAMMLAMEDIVIKDISNTQNRAEYKLTIANLIPLLINGITELNRRVEKLEEEKNGITS